MWKKRNLPEIGDFNDSYAWSNQFNRMKLLALMQKNPLHVKTCVVSSDLYPYNKPFLVLNTLIKCQQHKLCCMIRETDSHYFCKIQIDALHFNHKWSQIQERWTIGTLFLGVSKWLWFVVSRKSENKLFF